MVQAKILSSRRQKCNITCERIFFGQFLADSIQLWSQTISLHSEVGVVSLKTVEWESIYVNHVSQLKIEK